MILPAPNTVTYSEESNVQQGLSATAVPVWSPFVLSLIPPDIGLSPLQVAATVRPPRYDEGHAEVAQVRTVVVPRAGQRLPSRQDSMVVGGQTLRANQASQQRPHQDLQNVYDLVDQWLQLVNAEPLTWLINPQSLTIQDTKIAQHSEATREGFVYQAWGDEETRISITGTIGGYYSSQRGLHWLSRKDSVAWQHFSQILDRFRNGAAIYDRVGKSRMLRAVGWQRIDYDGKAWIGHMESFDYAFEAEKPHGGAQFTLEYVVSRHLYLEDPPTTVAPYQGPASAFRKVTP